MTSRFNVWESRGQAVGAGCHGDGVDNYALGHMRPRRQSSSGKGQHSQCRWDGVETFQWSVRGPPFFRPLIHDMQEDFYRLRVEVRAG